MKLSTKGTYGLRAILDVAENQNIGPVSISSIAERQNLSENYLEQLMSKLKKAGLITSVRGAQGGYTLSRDPADINVGEILRALEGGLSPVQCSAIDGIGERCENEAHCTIKYVWQKIDESINDTVDNIRLADLIKVSRDNVVTCNA